MIKKYVTIKEFAERAGISKQRVYQLLEKKLKPYFKAIENRMYIDESALDIVSNKKSNNSFQGVEQDLEQRLEQGLERLIQGLKHTEQGIEQKFEQGLEQVLESLTMQLKEKDKQIEELQSLLKISQEQQLLLSRSLTNSQALHAGTIKEHIEEKKKGLFSWLFKNKK